MWSTEVTYGTLPGGSWIDPAAPRPPVGFRLRLPASWKAVDLDPATSSGWVRSYVRERVDAAPELARQQRRMRRALGEFLDDCRGQGFFLLRQLAAVPGRPGERRVTVLSQFLVPIPGLPWLGVVTAASADRELADGIDAIADGVASSLEFLLPAGRRGATTAVGSAGAERVC